MAACDSDSEPAGPTEPEVTVPAEAVDLSAVETANCYIAAPGSVAAFSTAYKGNSTELSTGNVAGMKLLWQDQPALVADLKYAAGESKAVVWLSETEGNALVAAVDADDNILWSWHLWVTDYDPAADAYTTDPNANGTTWTFMTRNMGALSADPADGFATHGLVYQWGRKDPFPAPASYTEMDENYQYTPGMDGETTLYDIEGNTLPTVHSTTEFYGSVEKSIANPAVFYAMTYTYTGEMDEYGDEIVLNNPLTGDWADTSDDDRWGGVSMKKSIYDPCPPGWKVPVCDETGLTPYDWLTYAAMTWNNDAKGAEQNGQWFPACGTRVYASGGCDFSAANPYAGMWIGTAGKASADLITYPTLYGQYMFVINGKRTFKVNKDRRSQGMSLRAVRDL
ncbi:MAG: hypothetical protein K2I64_06135 [Muribaculaceae bacterium]|nr:hypothetical protein [Muribaculaceae bacterium]